MARQCKRCKCTNYAEAVVANGAGEIIACTICSQPRDILALRARSDFEDASKLMYDEAFLKCEPGETQKRIQEAREAARSALQWLRILQASLKEVS